MSCLETDRKEVLSIHCILSPPPYIPPSLIPLPPSLEPLHVFAFVSSPFSISNMLSLSSSIHCTDSSSFHPVLFVWLIGCAPNPHAHTPFYSPLFIVPALSFTGHKTLALRWIDVGPFCPIKHLISSISLCVAEHATITYIESIHLKLN